MRVVVVEDNALMLAATSGRLRNEPDIEVVGEASNPAEALQRVEEQPPDVVVLDLRLGRSTQEGMDLAAEIGRKYPSVRLLIYSAYLVERDKLAAPNIWGFVVKTAPPRSLVEGVRAVARGERYWREEPGMR